MANDEIGQTPLERRYGISQQSAFGTAIAEGGAFIELDCSDTQFNPDIKQIDHAGSHGSRTKRAGNVVTHNKNSAPVITFESLAKQGEVDHFIYNAMQEVYESSTSPFAKTFTFPTSQPDFQSDAGHFFTSIVRDPTAAKSWMVKDCITSTMTLTWEMGEPLKFSSELMGRGAVTTTYNPSGTWTTSTADFYYAPDIDRATINFGGGATAYHMESFELTISHELKPNGQDGAGSFQTWAMTNRQATFKLKVVHDSGFDNTIANWSGPIDVDINIGSGSTPDFHGANMVDGDIGFAIHGRVTNSEKTFDAILAGEFTGECLDGDGGSTAALTISVANAIDRAW